MSKSAIVIGAGFSSLSAACFLAQKGYQVKVLEKNAGPGGRAQQFKTDGFVFDMGPSWYWMPDVFENFFSKFGKKVSDYYHLKRLSPSYRVFFENNRVYNIPSSLDDFRNLFESTEKGAAKKLDQFLAEAGHKYQVGIHDLVYKPGRSLTEFIHPQFLAGLFKLDVFTSHSKHVRKFFSHPDLIRLLEFPVLFLGAKPEKTPALYSLMNYADIKLGTWYPDGGMFKIAEGMEKLARELGVEFEYQQPVQQFVVENSKVSKVKTTDKEYSADIIVGGADYEHLDQKVTPGTYRNYSASYWEKRVLAPSSIIFYLGINKRLNNLLHHNLFFDEDFSGHAVEIYDQPQWPSKPLFYVSCPSQTDDSVAPEGSENLFILIPVAPGLKDNEEILEKYYHLVMDRLEKLTGQSIREHVVYKRGFAQSDFIKEYNSFKGNAYGLANTLMQTAILKPSLKSKKLSNLYFTGQLTVPGPGVPPSLISGEVVAKEIAKEFPLH
jgi:phytoene desaturase